MEPYNFWQDAFDTYQSLSDTIKALWLVVPPLFLLALAALLTRRNPAHARESGLLSGKLVYSVYRDDQDRFHIVSHDPRREDRPSVLLPGPRTRLPTETGEK